METKKSGLKSLFEPRQRVLLVVAMVSVGEATGKVAESFLRLANHYERGLGLRRMFLAGITWPVIQLVATILREGKPLSELASQMDIYPQMLINVDVTHKPEISTLPAVVEAIKQVETELGDEGRVLVRYSGTENLCRVMVEGPGQEVTEKYCRQIVEALKGAIG